jgi:NADH-quinone oxidoreductase subunit C
MRKIERKTLLGFYHLGIYHMIKEELQNFITEKWPYAVPLEGGQWLNIEVPAENWRDLALPMRNSHEVAFDFLFCLTCVDWLKHLTMVYHLTSTRFRHTLVIKVNLDRNNPQIDTISDIWRTAEFHEREVYEMFGVHFANHPDLRKLILPDDWEGYPMRKDYEDPVNMIKL